MDPQEAELFALLARVTDLDQRGGLPFLARSCMVSTNDVVVVADCKPKLALKLVAGHANIKARISRPDTIVVFTLFTSTQAVQKAPASLRRRAAQPGRGPVARAAHGALLGLAEGHCYYWIISDVQLPKTEAPVGIPTTPIL